jgi:hypothetical protein
MVYFLNKWDLHFYKLMPILSMLRIWDVYPGSRIKDPTTGIFLAFLVAIIFAKLFIILFLNRYRKKFEPIEKELK